MCFDVHEPSGQNVNVYIIILYYVIYIKKKEIKTERGMKGRQEQKGSQNKRVENFN